jgi:soluble lytic murein transglycosylase
MKILKLLLIHLVAVPAAFVLTLLCACSTISSRQTLSYPFPPAKAADVWGRNPVNVDAALEKQHLSDPGNDPLRLLVRYQQARLWSSADPAKSCALWKEVLEEKRFPLGNIARLRAMESCPGDKGAFPSIESVMSSTPEPWLAETLLRASLKRAQRTADKVWEMKLSLQTAQVEKLQSEKVKLLQRAIELAQSLNDDTAKAEATTKLQMVAPRFNLAPTPEQYLSVAADFKQAREFEQARSWYRKIVDLEEASNADKLKALDGIRMSFKLEKKTEQYVAGTKDYSDFAAKNFLAPGIALAKKEKRSRDAAALIDKYLDTRITLARAIWTEGNPSEAQRILLAAEKETRRYISIDDSILVRARIEEEAGRFANAVKMFNSINVDNHSRDFRSKVLWFRAWNERKIGNLKEAAEALKALIPQEDSQTQASRDRFWLGKTLKELGQNAEANEQFQKLTSDDTLGWYGLLAYRELGQMIPPVGKSTVETRAPASEPKSTETALMPEEKLTFEWLLAGGESDLARRFLDQVTDDRRSGFSDAQSLDLLQSYARAGHYQSLFNRLYELPSSQRKRLLETNPELLFPQPWPTLVKTASSRFDVQTELIYSIMRQESSFNPMARSPADAFGLMQLIPEMAKKAATTAGISIEDHEDLYQPETNIPLGTAFVRGLQNYWNSGFIPTVASYNASEKAISGWIRSRYKGDTLAFIEDVPYEETRNYIKLVMRNFIFYKRLNSGGNPIPFPEWCLANLQDAKP